MSYATYKIPLHAHGVTPIRLGAQLAFSDCSSPLEEIWLADERLWVRYAVASASSAATATKRELLVLSVDDRDPVGASDKLVNWTYAGSFEVIGEIRHVWWHFLDRAAS